MIQLFLRRHHNETDRLFVIMETFIENFDDCSFAEWLVAYEGSNPSAKLARRRMETSIIQVYTDKPMSIASGLVARTRMSLKFAYEVVNAYTNERFHKGLSIRVTPGEVTV